MFILRYLNKIPITNELETYHKGTCLNSQILKMAAIINPDIVINIDITGIYEHVDYWIYNKQKHRSVRPTNQILKNNNFSQTIMTCYPYPDLVTIWSYRLIIHVD